MSGPLDFPKVRDAINKEKRIREFSFLRTPNGKVMPEQIGPFVVLPMSLNHLLILRSQRNAILAGETPGPADLRSFLWVLSPDYGDIKARKKFLRRCQSFIPPRMPLLHFPWLMRRWHRRCIKPLALATEIVIRAREYVDETFQDAPPVPAFIGFKPSYYSDACGLCASMAREFGYSVTEVMNMPLKAVFQFQVEKRNWNGSKIPNFNPSDLVIQKALN